MKTLETSNSVDVSVERQIIEESALVNGKLSIDKMKDIVSDDDSLVETAKKGVSIDDFDVDMDGLSKSSTVKQNGIGKKSTGESDEASVARIVNETVKKVAESDKDADDDEEEILLGDKDNDSGEVKTGEGDSNAQELEDEIMNGWENDKEEESTKEKEKEAEPESSAKSTADSSSAQCTSRTPKSSETSLHTSDIDDKDFEDTNSNWSDCDNSNKDGGIETMLKNLVEKLDKDESEEMVDDPDEIDFTEDCSTEIGDAVSIGPKKRPLEDSASSKNKKPKVSVDKVDETSSVSSVTKEQSESVDAGSTAKHKLKVNGEVTNFKRISDASASTGDLKKVRIVHPDKLLKLNSSDKITDTGKEKAKKCGGELSIDSSTGSAKKNSQSEFETVLDEVKVNVKPKLKKMSRLSLEQLLLEKMCDAIMAKSDLGKLMQQNGQMLQAIDMWKKRANQMQKQVNDMSIVVKKFMNDQRVRKDKPTIPVKITRSVGLQVSTVVVNTQRGLRNGNSSSTSVSSVTNTTSSLSQASSPAKSSPLKVLSPRPSPAKQVGGSPLRPSTSPRQTTPPVQIPSIRMTSPSANPVVSKVNLLPATSTISTAQGTLKPTIVQASAAGPSLMLVPASSVSVAGTVTGTVTGTVAKILTQRTGTQNFIPPAINMRPGMKGAQPATVVGNRVVNVASVASTLTTTNVVNGAVKFIDLTGEEEANKLKGGARVNTVSSTAPTGGLRVIPASQLKAPPNILTQPAIPVSANNTRVAAYLVPTSAVAGSPRQLLLATSSSAVRPTMTPVPSGAVAVRPGNLQTILFKGTQLVQVQQPPGAIPGTPTILRPVSSSQLPRVVTTARTISVASSTPSVQATSRSSSSVATSSRGHPAPLPAGPPNTVNSSMLKQIPPKPGLKITKVSNGIVLSWNMTATWQYEEIASYQLFAYQESSAPPSTSLWKKVGDVKALPLPMACTLTQFLQGHQYHFAVRAVDVHNRVGPFSDPGSIFLVHTQP